MSFFADLSSSRGRRFTLAPLKHPIVLISTVLMAVLWIAVWHHIAAENEARRRNAMHEAVKAALLLEQNVSRVVSEIDRILDFLRQVHARSGYAADWVSLVKAGYTVHNQVAQVAVIDAQGKLITSTSLPSPRNTIDLSDRAHFRFHIYSNDDQLFISNPVLGRATNKWTVQFTRRFETADGGFGGVLVVSLDPTRFAETNELFNIGDKGGFAVAGADGTVLAGAGRYAPHFAKPLPRRDVLEGGKYLPDGTVVHFVDEGDAVSVTAGRPVRGLPLFLSVWSEDTVEVREWRLRRNQFLLATAILSLVIGIGAVLTASGFLRKDRRVTHLARHDALTGIANRSRFMDVLKASLGGIRDGRGIALHVLDLDGFKSINDTHGHPFGDKLLKQVAARLRESVRSGDLVGRLGGDEFVVLQMGVAEERQAHALAGRLLQVVSRPYDIEGVAAKVGVSIGVDLSTDGAISSDEMMKRADLALYCAKTDGRGVVRPYSESMGEAIKKRQALEAELRRAVEAEQFEIHYQPIIAIGSGEVVSYEALVRWRHPERGLVPPLDFIPIAEATGLILPIGAWVLARACTDMASRPTHLKVAVNISPLQFTPALIGTIREALERSGLQPGRLELEITESTLLQSSALTVSLLGQIRSMGIHISLDDFGTGYSSLSYLQTYPFSCIKIDRAFVKTLGTGEERGAGIIRAITSMASALGMSTVAEGVETRAQLSELMTLGCTEAQGYLFSPPRRAEEILPSIAKAPPVLVAAE
jgi:diguanylate cyclase (GGDEF)-like protein